MPNYLVLPKHLIVATLRTLLAVAFCVFCFVQYVHVTTIDTSLLANLAVKTPGVPDVNPKASTHMVLDMTTSPFTVALHAYERDPGQTGGYSTIWNGTLASKRSAVMVFDLLPTPQLAGQVLAQARKEFFSKKAFKVYSKEVPIPTPQIPGAEAFREYSAATAQAPAGQTVMFLFGYQRVAVVELVSAPSVQPGDGLVLANREYQLLKRLEPTFVMQFTTRPIVGTVFYVLGSLVLSAVAFFGPSWVAQGRIRRKELQEAALRRHKQVRGSKTLRRRQVKSQRR
jgi:hypothetical protein